MRTVPIRQSLHRHNLVLGGERELVMFSTLIAFLVGVGGTSITSGICAVVFWLIAIYILRLLAKKDPQMSKVWLRHIRQQDYYPARSSCWRQSGGFKKC